VLGASESIRVFLLTSAVRRRSYRGKSSSPGTPVQGQDTVDTGHPTVIRAEKKIARSLSFSTGPTTDETNHPSLPDARSVSYEKRQSCAASANPGPLHRQYSGP